jgi:hypothetical protein
LAIDLDAFALITPSSAYSQLMSQCVIALTEMSQEGVCRQEKLTMPYLTHEPGAPYIDIGQLVSHLTGLYIGLTNAVIEVGLGMIDS